MVQVARLAPKVLQNSTQLVVDFYQSQRLPEGGFCDRAGNADLYYSVFGIEGSQALQQPLDDAWLLLYVQSFGDASSLDLVHAACLSRCWAAISPSNRRQSPCDAIYDKILAHRTPDGGYDGLGMGQGNLYSCFMAVGAFQDLGFPIPDVEQLIEFIISMRDPKGGYFNNRDLPISLVPQTAAAVNLLHRLGYQIDEDKIVEWLLSCLYPEGGFRAGSIVAMPDLLSTATALHALASLKVDLGGAADLCLDFVDSLWTNRGGFYGEWEDTHVDVEYTYYALLALGHLSLLTKES